MGDNNSKENGIFMPYDQFGRLCYALAHAKTTMYDSEHTVYDMIRILAAGGDINSTPVLSVNGNTGDVNITADDLGVTKTYYCTCDTDPDISNKILNCEDTSFTLKKGVEINVYFTYNNNSGSAITLNVNSTGAIRVVFAFGTTYGYYKIANKSICKFIYDGTYWRLIGGSVRGDSDYGVAKPLAYDSHNFITERAVYYGTPKINDSKSYTSNTNIYVPTTIGKDGQILKSNGVIPVWEDFKLPKFKIIYELAAGDSDTVASIDPNEYNEFLLVVTNPDKLILYSILLPCDYDYRYGAINGPVDTGVSVIPISYGSGMVLIRNLYTSYSINIYAR